MKRFYYFIQNRRNSVIELRSNTPFAILDDCLHPSSDVKIPDDSTFKVVKGKKWTDAIILFESGITFYSQRLVDLLQHYTDITNQCYPIRIVDSEERYYTFYNMITYTRINPRSVFEDEPPYFLLPPFGEVSPFFTVGVSSLEICTEEVKKAMEKAKLTNIRFVPVYGLTEEEFQLWKQKHELG